MYKPVYIDQVSISSGAVQLFIAALSSPVVTLLITVFIFPTTLDPQEFYCPVSQVAPLHLQLREQFTPPPPVATSAVAPCALGSTRNWLNECEVPFGIEPSILGSTPACVSVYESVCGAYTHEQRQKDGVPRGFTMAAAQNAALLKHVRKVESLRVWARGPWARVAGACARNQREEADAEGEKWLGDHLREVRQLATHNSSLVALARAVSLGAVSPLHVSVRQNPRNRSRRALYIELHGLRQAPELTLQHPNSVGAQRVLATVDRRLALDARHHLQLQAALASSVLPSTLFAYALNDGPVSLATDLWESSSQCVGHNCQDRALVMQFVDVLRVFSTEDIEAVDDIWAFSLQQVASVLRATQNRASEMVHYLSEELVSLYAAPGARARKRATQVAGDAQRRLVHKMGSAPPFGLTTQSGSSLLQESDETLAWPIACQDLATSEVWWRVDRWFEDASRTGRRKMRIGQMFTKLQSSMLLLIDMRLQDLQDDSFVEFLKEKVRTIRLRFRSRPRKRWDDDERDAYEAPTSLVAELYQLQRHRFKRFAPFWDDLSHRYLDATDLSAARSNAFYSATDNSLTVFPGLLAGAMYSDTVNISRLYATLGAVLGHEMAHAIDSRGIWYDTQGSVIEPASRSTLQKYLSRMRCIVNFFVERNMDGVKVMDESFADSMGLQAAVIASELTGSDHAVFLQQYTQLWCGQLPDDRGWADRDDPHAPPRDRAEFALQSVEQLRTRAFGCTSSTEIRTDVCTALGLESSSSI